MRPRRLRFWLGVAGVSILANFGIELLNARVPSIGLAKFTDFTHGNADANRRG
jgi:hypothetical protein